MLEKHESSLGDEKWDVMEQAFYACIDMGQNDLAETYLNRLSEQFPGLYCTKVLISSDYTVVNGQFKKGL